MRTMHGRRNDLNLLVSFHRLLQTRSVTAAAAEEGVTQSAMSRTLTRLRATFNDPLFVRTRRGLEPTKLALELEVAVRTAVETAGAVFQGPRTGFDAAATTRQFTIATTDIAALVVLPRLLQRM